MGNINSACQMSNHSHRNVRVFVTEKVVPLNGFVTSEAGGDQKSFFRKDINCIRVLASQTREVAWEAQHFVSIFVEDEDDEDICSRNLLHNMAMSAPVTVLLYDV